MADEAIMDSAVDDVAVDESVVDTPDGGAETEAPEESAEVADPSKPGAPDPAAAANQPAVIDGKKLSEQAQNTLKEIATKDPALARQLRTALFTQDRLAREFPGGFKEVGEIKQALTDIGGLDGLKSVRSELGFWNDFDKQFTAADPKIIETMIADDAGKDAFMSLAPDVFSKFAELNPDGYSGYIARAIVGDMHEKQIPLAMNQMLFYIQKGEMDEALKQYGVLATFMNGLGKMAQNPLKAEKKAPVADPAAGNTRVRELEQQVSDNLRSNWKQETATQQTPVFRAEWDRLAAGRKIGEKQKAGIEQLFEMEFGQLVKPFREKLDRYFAVKDKDGFFKLSAGITKTELPKALQSAFDKVMPDRPDRPGPKAAIPGAKPAVAAVPGKPSNSFVFVGKMPSSGEIDTADARNTPKLFGEGKAFLKDGRRVSWKR